jgi:hypothetical protein
MSSANTVRNSWTAGDMCCLASNARYSETSSHAVPLPSAHTSSNVTIARTRSFGTNLVATGIAQSATAGPATSGSLSGRRRFYPSPIPMLCSPYRESWHRWRYRTHESSMGFCFVPPPSLCWS